VVVACVIEAALRSVPEADQTVVDDILPTLPEATNYPTPPR